jgi:hypothetical protein
MPGSALDRGKLELYNAYQQHDSYNVEKFTMWNALAGDPGILLYTHAIQYMDCDIPASVTWGENSLTLTVNETGVGPLEGARVCFYRENEIQEVGLTDANGQITLPLNPLTAGNVKVTVTKSNFHPLVDSLDVIQADVAVGYYSHTIDDDENGSSSGDNDGTINPGETVEIPLVFKNYGNATTATGINVTATENDDYISLGDSYETFPNLSPGSTGNSYDDLDLIVDTDCPHGRVILLNLSTNSGQGVWDGVLELEVVSYDLDIRRAYAFGSDTLLSPGETANFILEVENTGAKAAESLTATIVSLSEYVTVNDNAAGFGMVNPGSVASCAVNTFGLTASTDTPPGYPADLEVTFTSASGATQTEIIRIFLGVKTSTDPQGPDEYGYWCFDNTDTGYATAPVYNWVEINPASGGQGTQLPIDDTGEDDDMSIVVRLPFTFQYYGEETDEITICSNGWISYKGNNAYANFTNHPIPSYMSPDGIITAFWDDLITGSGGNVYAWNDNANHRCVIQWDNMRNRGNTGIRETFEIILFDPEYYSTPTGDGEILFQYQQITEVFGYSYDNPYSTVGIERPDHQDGIEVVYWNACNDPAAAILASNRAYLFTTDFEYGIAPAEITIDLTYQSGSPVPELGGNLYFDLYLENVGTSAADFDAWLDIQFEGGTPWTVVERSFINYLPGWSINRPNMYFPVPNYYGAGDYFMLGRVGDNPDIVWAEDSFPWIKSGDDGWGEGPLVPNGVPNPFDVINKKDPVIAAPLEFEVLGTYPNPFNPTTNISFALPDTGEVKLHVFDINGRLVTTLVDGHREAGIHDVTFDAQDLSSGIYFYRLSASKLSASGKMVLVK